MNYIYDIVLNFFDVDNSLEFFEWNKEDNIVEIEKIPIFKLDRNQMNDILNYKIKVDNSLLSKICNRTIYANGFLKYSVLVSDLNKVVGLKFDDNGYLIQKSNLLLDEEDAVIDEICGLEYSEFKYELFEKKDTLSFLTRRERFIREYLINEINYLYKNKVYDQINYLYREIFDDKGTIKKMYEKLIDGISNNYDSKYNKLYDICILACR